MDLHGRRLRLMDEHGMAMMILSLNAPAIQAIPDPKKANEIARKANDYLAEQVRKRPDRFQALAALPLQDPDLATRELQRCVKDLGMVGALANGFSQIGDPNTIAYLDEKQYWPFWSVCEQLDVPFYLHPRNPLPQDSRIYKDHGWLMGPTWAFGHETAVHALRLMGSGLFDKHPKLAIILGHMGEGLPFSLWRISQALSRPGNKDAGFSFRDHFSEHFWITTSGNFSNPALLCSVMEMGVDRILFAVDWPMVDHEPAEAWVPTIPLCKEDVAKIMHGNAQRLLKL